MFAGRVHLLFALCIIFFIQKISQAQYYDAGQDPGNLKWRMVLTKDFKLVYPEIFETNIQSLIPELDSIYASVSKSLFFSPARTPVIFHPYNAQSNGFTALAPKRIELYTCPPQDIYADDWLRQLMIHEFRHVVQLDQTNRGGARFFYFLFGEQALAAINGLFVPSWFMEGDAVCTETAFSNSGRGRLPSFEMPLRTQVLQKGFFSYDKASMGSYKDYIPNQYYLGYHLVADIRKRYGYTSWINTLTEVSNLTTFITPFNFGLKQATGLNKTTLYKSVMRELDSLWNKQLQRTLITDYEQISPDYKVFTNFNYPQFLSNNKLVALKSGMDDIAELVVIDENKLPKKIFYPGFISSYQYSVWNKNLQAKSPDNENEEFRVVWAEFVPDKRWAQRSFSDIRIFDSSTGKTKSLTHKGRYFSPVFSPDGKSILAVSATYDNKFSLVIIDSGTGEQTKVVVKDSERVLMSPSWSKTSDSIVYAQLDKSGKSFYLIGLKTGEIKQVLAPTTIEVNNPVFAGKYILFNGSYSGIENIYAIEIATSNMFQVTSSEYGACNACLSPDERFIVYSNYTSSGYEIARMACNTKNWKPITEVENYSIKLYENITREEQSIKTKVFPVNSNYASEPYKKTSNLFTFHSWAPVYMNYLSGNNSIGVSAMSQNELSTLTTVAGFAMDFYENSRKVIADLQWKGSYPIVDMHSSYGVIFHSEDTNSVRIPDQNEASFALVVSLPMVFKTGVYTNGMRVKAAMGIRHLENRGVENMNGTENKYNFSWSLQLYRIRKQAARDIYPKFGQVINATLLYPAFNAKNQGRLLAAEIRTYFPGLLKHHSAYASLSFQHRNDFGFFSGSYIGLPRGYFTSIPERISWLSVNYKFPFAYPDWSVQGILYCKRLKMNAFYDFSFYLPEHYTPMRSLGVELTADTHLFRTIYPFELGLRLSFLPRTDKFVSNFMISLNLPE